MHDMPLKTLADAARGSDAAAAQRCQRVRVTGLVQGVGFRPFVWRLAKELDLHGWVRNDAHGVDIEAAGAPRALAALVARLRSDAPPAARIDSLSVHAAPLRAIADDFFILNSRAGRAAAMIEADSGICRDCLGAMFDPDNRRWRYAFTSCAHCGPRYTICRALPYARERTSYKPFAPCAKCANEARRSDDRQHGNETIVCPKCGPKLALLGRDGEAIDGDAVETAMALLQQGKILAIKGVGGFQLVVDARNANAVAALRARRGGDAKPFAVMLANATSASSFVQLGVGEPGLLAMPERPIILLKKRPQCDAALAGVAPSLGWLGVMMPGTPLDYLLFHEAAGRPRDLAWLAAAQDLALAVAAADSDSDPLVTANIEAIARLAGIADAFLLHDREIVVRCDETIARAAPGGLQFVRRGRGYAPRAIKLPRSGPPLLAVGSSFKNTVCVTRGDEAFVSQHIGDLERPAACAFLEQTVSHLVRLLDVKPALVVHDLDRSQPAQVFAADFARQRGVPLLAVPHHHAHAAAVLAEHLLDTPVLALVLDALAAGPDGVCGGGLLHAAGASFERAGALRPLLARHGARAPWQPAVAGEASLACYINAAAALLGIEPAFTGHAAMALEALAETHGEVAPLAGGWQIDASGLDLVPLFDLLGDEKNAARGAALFHSTLVAALADWVDRHAPAAGTLVGAGACFLNLVLARGLRAQLAARGLHLLEARRLPANDGGIALGQAWIAQQYLLV